MKVKNAKKVRSFLALNQCALGITNANANPDFIPILRYAREKGIVPNYTTSGYGLNQEIMEATAELCGAVAVSAYPHNQRAACNAMGDFINAGMKQVNMHLLYYKENLDFCRDMIAGFGDRPGLNAVVLLALKPVGRAKGRFTPASRREFGELVDFAFRWSFSIGFDSCSACAFEQWVRKSDMPEDEKKRLIMMSDSCEASAFSAYCDVDGTFWPCSFLEGAEGIPSVSILEADDFVRDVWFDPGVTAFRERFLATRDEHGTRRCPVYDI